MHPRRSGPNSPTLLCTSLCALVLIATPLPGHAVDPGSAPAAADESPALWEVTRFDHPDSGLYLLAELGFGRLPVDGFAPEVEQAFAAARTLIVPLDDMLPSFASRAAQAVDSQRFLQRKTLPDLLSEADYADLRTILARSGWQPDAMDTSRPWYAQGWLEWSFYEGRGFDMANAERRALLERARGQQRIIELDDLDSRTRVITELDDRTAAAMLRYTLRNRSELSLMPVLFEQALASGDFREVEAMILRLRREEPAFERGWERMVEQPAQRYAERLVELSGEPGIQLAVLPIGMMLGERGVPALLASQKLDVRRVRRNERLAPRERVREAQAAMQELRWGPDRGGSPVLGNEPQAEAELESHAAPPAIPAPDAPVETAGPAQPAAPDRARSERARAEAPRATRPRAAPRALSIQRGASERASRSIVSGIKRNREGSLQFRRYAQLGPQGLARADMEQLGCPPCQVVSLASPVGERGVAQSQVVFTLEPRDVVEALVVDSADAGSLDADSFGLVLVLAEHARPRIEPHAFDQRGSAEIEFLAASVPGATTAYTALIHSRGITLALPTRSEALRVARRLGLSSSR